MKKRLLVSLVASFALAFCLFGCASGTEAERESAGAEEQSAQESTPTSVTITHELGTVEVPYDPQRIAVIDMASLDIIDSLGMGERVIGVPKSTTLDYLDSYMDDDVLVDLGTVKEVDMEALMEAEPDVIFIGGRLTDSYEALSEIAPVIMIGTDTEQGLVESVDHNLEVVCSLFGLEEEAAEKSADFGDRVAKLNEAAAGQTCIMGMVTSGNFNTLGNDSRCSLIVNEVGFENLAADVESTHGDSASFELLVEKNPDWIFALDRDSAIGTDGAAAAKDIMDNALVQQTSAYQNDQIVYLTPGVWYLAEGGVTALDIMLQDLEKALL